MRKLQILIVSLILGMLSCKKENTNPDLIGKWKLIEEYINPGANYHEEFVPTTANRTLEFHKDGTVYSNHDICLFSSDSSSACTGSYSLVDSSITAPCCTMKMPGRIYFKIKDQNLLIYYTACDEGCCFKYVKN